MGFNSVFKGLTIGSPMVNIRYTPKAMLMCMCPAQCTDSENVGGR